MEEVVCVSLRRLGWIMGNETFLLKLWKISHHERILGIPSVHSRVSWRKDYNLLPSKSSYSVSFELLVKI